MLITFVCVCAHLWSSGNSFKESGHHLPCGTRALNLSLQAWYKYPYQLSQPFLSSDLQVTSEPQRQTWGDYRMLLCPFSVWPYQTNLFVPFSTNLSLQLTIKDGGRAWLVRASRTQALTHDRTTSFLFCASRHIYTNWLQSKATTIWTVSFTNW